jgi:UDP-3-O-[3-hydroxymyristoyl] glucosamine N-acyltransferase
MADARFFDNRGPFPLSGICAAAGISVPPGVDAAAKVTDVAALADAGPAHLSFFAGARGRKDLAATGAGWCLMPQDAKDTVPSRTVALVVPSVQHAFAAAARLFYPDHELCLTAQETHVHPAARLGEGVVLGPGVVIGSGAEIGRGTRIGANSVIGRGVAIGRGNEIAANVSIAFAYLGDDVVVQSGARIGGSGFGFASSRSGHVKIPQIGRVIIQDRVEIGANACLDRGTLADTVIGEGTKIDNLVHIAHNCRIGRHSIITADVAMAGSVTIGDFVMIGGKAGFADHVNVGDGVRIAGMAGVMSDLPPGSGEYAGLPARPARTYFKEQAVLARLTKSYKKTKDE